MNILTKVFVVLSVILSIVVSSGFVVFVNRVEDFRKENVDARAKLAASEREVAKANDAAQASKAASDLIVAQANSQVAAIQAQIETLNRQILDQKAEVAKANAARDSALASLQGAQAAITAAQNNSGVLQAQLLETRKSVDEAQKKILEQNLSIADMSNRNQVLERQLRQAMEDIVALKDDAKTAGSSAPAGGAMNNALPASDGGVAINGVIRATQTIAGVKYATISIGSADAVRKGMQFHVLGGRNGSQFLGYVNVTSVEPHEAVGRLSGPRVNEVTAENEVRSRL